MTDQTNGFTLDQLNALEKSIAEGVKKVKYSDKEVEYRSISEMLKVRDMMRAQLGLKSKCGKKGLFGGTRVNAQHSKGLDDC